MQPGGTASAANFDFRQSSNAGICAPQGGHASKAVGCLESSVLKQPLPCRSRAHVIESSRSFHIHYGPGRHLTLRDRQCG